MPPRWVLKNHCQVIIVSSTEHPLPVRDVLYDSCLKYFQRGLALIYLLTPHQYIIYLSSPPWSPTWTRTSLARSTQRRIHISILFTTLFSGLHVVNKRDNSTLYIRNYGRVEIFSKDIPSQWTEVRVAYDY